MSHFRPIALRSYGSYGCGCGCNSCGGQEAYGSLAYGALSYGMVHRAVRTVPEYGSGWFFGKTFENYNPDNSWYRKCAEYRKACDDFAAFRQKVIGVYGTKMKDQSCGSKANCKSDPYLASAATADKRLLELQAKARQIKDQCKSAEKAAKKGDADTVTTTGLQNQQTVSNVDTSTDSGSSVMPFVVGGIGLAVMVAGAVIIKKRRKAAKLAAQQAGAR